MAPTSHQSFTDMAGIGQMSLHKKKTSLEQSSSLHKQIRDIINPKYLKKEREKNLKFPQEWRKDEMRHIVQLIHLKGWARHFEHEYIIKLSKKGSCPPSIESYYMSQIIDNFRP